jgi:hypothetical protein
MSSAQSSSVISHAAQGGADGPVMLKKYQVVGPNHIFLAGCEYGITLNGRIGCSTVECFGGDGTYLYFCDIEPVINERRYIYALTELEARNNIVFLNPYGAMSPVFMQNAPAPWFHNVLRWTPNMDPSAKDLFVAECKFDDMDKLKDSLVTLKDEDLPRERARLATARGGVNAAETRAVSLQAGKAKLEADILELDCFLGGKMNATQVLKADIEDKKTSLRDAEVALTAQLQTAQGKLNQARSQLAACANDSAKRELAEAERAWCELDVKNAEMSLIANSEIKKSITDLIAHHEGSLNRMMVHHKSALGKKTVMEHRLATEFSSEAVNAGVADAHQKLEERFGVVQTLEADIAKKTGMIANPFHAEWAGFMPVIEGRWNSHNQKIASVAAHNARKRAAENANSAEKVSRPRVDNDGAAGGAAGGPVGGPA